ncbi:AcrR family transcriptional regulator [Streptomyces sp. SAI-135]|uniref:TetR/AcrR family transcriptional regulator n=2 Tax=unclassified Streptomyces TaxID=2593676 RepID=UPI002473F49A|nr:MULTISPECIES: TetR/AcrR family transcriptional regulator [unclassified Streptomyces]MDH6523078.1 AcrR family transcriptional regulator [Streptomyces sp. SAI-090]MDH6573961.1 AcrR family transcriptional regulator [Streptomyces sp. SAI-117]MDH6581302.1 AcrR family transcriptional regulator [Streptomyces sp. SAI-133]MDH6613308.1 AcrR family transcriptional regulator [Streptomyces sp. SAI-135]
MTEPVQNPTSPADSAAGRRSRNARGEGTKLREEILQAMLRLIADESRMQTVPLSLREVAREAGVTAPAIYLHFTDREELSRAAVSALYEQLLDEMNRAEETSAGHSPARQLAEVAHAYCRFAQNNPTSFRVMFTIRNRHRDEIQQVADCWRRSVARMAETGIRLAQTPEAAAVSLWSAVHGRLLLGDDTANAWRLGDVHHFVDELARSLSTVDGHSTPPGDSAP